MVVVLIVGLIVFILNMLISFMGSLLNIFLFNSFDIVVLNF